MTARRWLFEALDPESPGSDGLSLLNKAIVALIVASVVATVPETEPTLGEDAVAWMEIFQIVAGLLFLIEYLARLWVCVEHPRYAEPLRGRMRRALTPAALLTSRR